MAFQSVGVLLEQFFLRIGHHDARLTFTSSEHRNVLIHKACRLAASYLLDDETTKKLFTTLAPRFETKQGGYTRITKIGFRRGDGAPMAIIELV